MRHLSAEHIRQCCTTRVLPRGKEYYNDGAVDAVEFVGSHLLKAEVSGSKFYQVRIQLLDNSVDGTCTCPYYYEGACKHIVAVLFYALKQYKDIPTLAVEDNHASGVHVLGAHSGGSPAKKHNMEEIRQYLESLSHERLVSMVLDLAPDAFLQHIQAHLMTDAQAKRLLENTHKSIIKIMNNTRLMEEASRFEKALLEQLESLRGMWHRHYEEVAEIVLEVMTSVEAAVDERDLCTYDYYGNDEYFASDALDDYISAFLRAAPLERKQEYRKRVLEIAQNSHYGTFDGVRV